MNARTWLWALAAAGLCAAPAAGQRLYVWEAATGADNGMSWEDAYVDLQDALAEARNYPGTIQEIWVAQGTYKPTGDSDRTISFALVDGVAVYGGFGADETQLDQRDPAAHETILCGEIGDPGVTTDNSYHVVTSDNCGSGTILDGFSITAGQADGTTPHYEGGGLRIALGSPLVRQCRFHHNWGDDGGGICSWDASRIEACRFEANRAYQGGGLSGNGTVVDCLFEGNQAAYEGGGASSDGSFERCRFLRNRANSGGAVFTYMGLTLKNCLLADNQAHSLGGGVYCDAPGYPYLRHCTLANNTASSGSAVYLYTPAATADHCIFWGGTPPLLCGVGNYYITFSDVLGEWAGGGDNNINADPLFVNPAADDYHLQRGSPCINAGDSAFTPEAGETDLDGQDRVLYDTTDMGADEFLLVGDVNMNAFVDVSDVLRMAGSWGLCEGEMGYDLACDLTGDDCVDAADLLLLAENFGHSLWW